MSRDIQVISVVDDLQVTSVEDIEGAEPRTLRIVGEAGFSSAQRVEINNYGIDDFTIVNDRLILAAPGAALDGVSPPEMSVVIVAGSLSTPTKARLVLGPTRRTRSVNGVQKLVQQVVKSLLSDAASNRFDISEGGGLVQSVGSSLSPSSRSRVAAAVSRAVSVTEELFIAAQATDTRLSSTEKLLKLELASVDFVSSTGSVDARIRLVTYAGTQILVPLTL